MGCYIEEYAESKISEMEDRIKRMEFTDRYIRCLISKQNGKLSVNSKYYEGVIATGNWSQIEDLNIKKLDMFDGKKEIEGIAKKEKDAEYEYVFIPSYYVVKILILYYMKNPKQAERIYGLKNAVVRRNGEEFFGGLPFILKYIGGDFVDDRVDFLSFTEELLDYYSALEINNENNISNNFFNDIIDCICDFYGKDLVLERRIKNFNESKLNWFYIDFYKEKGLLLDYTPLNDYKILGHKDIKKDLNHLQKEQAKKAKKKIMKTPNHPNNDSPKDSEKLQGDLQGWYSQRISKKDRLVYKKDSDNKIVYIATACSHYDEASRRIKSTCSYRLIKE